MIFPSQYSVTSYERDLTSHDMGAKDAQGHTASHGSAGIPGVFFNYEISPMLVIHTEERQSFAHFLTSFVPSSFPPPFPLASLSSPYSPR